MLASPGWASSVAVTAYLDNVNPTDSVDVQFTVGQGVTEQTVGFSTPYVGQINWILQNVSGSALDEQFLGSPTTKGALNPNGDGRFMTFCVEGTQDVYIGADSTWATLTSLDQVPFSYDGLSIAMGSNAATVLQQFWSRHVGDIKDSTTAAAFQLDVWEIVYDTTTDYNTTTLKFNPHFDSGKFQAGNNTLAVNQAATWLNDAKVGIGGTAGYTTYNLYALSDPYLQDQVFGVESTDVVAPKGGNPNRPSSPVPLPAAFPAGLAGLGLLGAAAFLRRRRAQTCTI